MPYKLRKAPKRELYWVVNKETGKKHSKDPLPKERALAQMRALYASEDDAPMRGSGKRKKQVLAELLTQLDGEGATDREMKIAEEDFNFYLKKIAPKTSLLFTSEHTDKNIKRMTRIGFLFTGEFLRKNVK